MNLPVKMDSNNVNMDMIMNMSMYKVCDIFMIMNKQDMYICTYLKNVVLTLNQQAAKTEKERPITGFFGAPFLLSTGSWSSLAEWSGLC
jgi:hypothetical protein